MSRHMARILARSSSDVAHVYVALDRAGVNVTKAGDHLIAQPHDDPSLVKTIRAVTDAIKQAGFTWKSSSTDLKYENNRSTVTISPRQGRLFIQVQ